MKSWARVLRWVVLAVAFCAAAPGASLGANDPLGSAPATPSLLAEEECAPTSSNPCPPALSDEPGGAKAPAGRAPLTQEAATAALLPAGAPAKPFTLDDLEGKAVGFDAKPGMRPMLLVFWSIFCEPCRDELPLVEEMVKGYAERGLVLLTVNVDGVKMGSAVERYRKLNRLGFPVVLDQKVGREFVTAAAYGVTGTPSLFLVGSDGAVRWNHAGRIDPTVLEAQIRELLGS